MFLIVVSMIMVRLVVGLLIDKGDFDSVLMMMLLMMLEMSLVKSGVLEVSVMLR